MCGKVESHGKSFLSRCQVTAVESVGLFSRGEAGILTDGPGTHHIHGRIRPAQVRSYSGSIVQMLHALEVLFGIHGFHRYLFRCEPIGFDFILFSPLVCVDGRKTIRLNVYFLKIRFHIIWTCFLFFISDYKFLSSYFHIVNIAY